MEDRTLEESVSSEEYAGEAAQYIIEMFEMIEEALRLLYAA